VGEHRVHVRGGSFIGAVKHHNQQKLSEEQKKKIRIRGPATINVPCRQGSWRGEGRKREDNR